MLHFPDEDRRVAQTRHKLKDHFSHAERLLDFWAYRRKDKWMEKSGLPGNVLTAASLLDVQACRHFRCIIEDCKRAEALSANILSRTLYETFLALSFVLAKRVRIRTKPVIDGNTNTQKIGKDGLPQFSAGPVVGRPKKGKMHYLDRRLRANRYLCHLVFEDEKFIEKGAATEGLKTVARRFRKQADKKTLDEASKLIGPEWTSILWHNDSYSGLSVLDLAKLMHPVLVRWYRSVYHIQSRPVHGTSAPQAFEETPRGLSVAWFSDVNQLNEVMRTAVTMFICCTSIIEQEINLGTATATGMHGLKLEFRTLYQS